MNNNCTYTAQGFLTCPSKKNATYAKESFGVTGQPQWVDYTTWDQYTQRSFQPPPARCTECVVDKSTFQGNRTAQFRCKCDFCKNGQPQSQVTRPVNIDFTKPINWCGTTITNTACTPGDAFSCYTAAATADASATPATAATTTASASATPATAATATTQ